uniref:Eye53 n=1 Tax=Dugesia japonica TaxID=6161 RepID=Q6L8A4_DUGJA|nr:eye53 [Dugesia japonica]
MNAIPILVVICYLCFMLPENMESMNMQKKLSIPTYWDEMDPNKRSDKRLSVPTYYDEWDARKKRSSAHKRLSVPSYYEDWDNKKR